MTTALCLVPAIPGRGCPEPEVQQVLANRSQEGGPANGEVWTFSGVLNGPFPISEFLLMPQSGGE